MSEVGQELSADKKILQFFGIKRMPFTTQIEVDNLLETKAMRGHELKMSLAVKNHEFLVLLGQPGCGKSTLLRHFVAKLNQSETTIIYISESQLSPRWLYGNSLISLGLEPKFYRGDSKRALNVKLEELLNAGKQILVIVDEAHLTCSETLQEIRFFLNSSQFDAGSNVSLILAGQNELMNILKRPQNIAINQRIDYVCHLDPLSKEECKEYIDLRLKDVNCTQEFLTPDAFDRVFDLSQGCMRIVNKICKHVMLYSAYKNKLPADVELIDEIAVQEMLCL